MKKILTILLFISAFAASAQTRPVITRAIMDSIRKEARKAAREEIAAQKGLEVVIGEVLTGTVDGVNKVFTLAARHVANTEEIYVKGLRLTRVTDYTLTTTSTPTRITFKIAPTAQPIGDYIK